MKIPFWKKWLSYFTFLTLEKRKSEYSGQIEILLSRGRLAMATSKAFYSYEDLYLNFRKSFEKIDLRDFDIDKVLILGAGLLSIPYILEKKHSKNYKYKVVDIDATVLNLASKYALPKLYSNIELVCADALEFVKNERDRFKLIIVDIFIDDIVPEVFESLEFLEGLKKILESKGLLMYNRMSQNLPAKIQTEKFYNNNFTRIFKNSEIIDLSENKMLLAYG